MPRQVIQEKPHTGWNWLNLAYLLSALFVILFLAVPVGKILWETVQLMADGKSVPVDLYSYMLRITWNSIRLALTTTFFSLLLAIPLAVSIAKLRVPFSTGWTILLTVPLITPPLISSFATILLFGRNGILMKVWEMVGLPPFNIYGLTGLVITQVLHLTPYALTVILAGLRSVPPQIEEAAMNLGSSFFGTTGKVVLPYIFPHILMGGVLIFLTSLGDVGAPLLIGGNYRVLPVEIYSNFVSFLGDKSIPIIFSAWVILLSLVMLVFVRKLLKRTEVKHSFQVSTLTYDLPKLRKVATVLCAVVTLLFLLPYITIVISSFGTIWTTDWLPKAFTLDNYKQVITDVVPMRNTLILVSAALPLSLLGSVILGHMNRSLPKMAWFDFLTLLPFVVPGVVLGVGLIRSYNGLVFAGIDFTGTILVLIVALTIRRMPHAIRILAAAFARIDHSLEEASWSLGASKSKTFADVVLPQLRPTIFAAGVIVLVKLIAELSATLILYPPGWQTLSVYIYYYVSEGQVARGSAMSIVLIILIGIGTALSNKLSASKNRRLD